jgi:hypothetical protein
MNIESKFIYHLLSWSNPWAIPNWNGNLWPHTLFEGFAKSCIGKNSTGIGFIQKAYEKSADDETNKLLTDFEKLFAGDIKPTAPQFYRKPDNNNPTVLCDWIVCKTKDPVNNFGDRIHSLLQQRGFDPVPQLEALLKVENSRDLDPLTRALFWLPDELELTGLSSSLLKSPDPVETLSKGEEEEEEAENFIRAFMPVLGASNELNSSDKFRRIESLRYLSRALTVAVANLVLSAPWRLMNKEPALLLAFGGKPGEGNPTFITAAIKRLNDYAIEHRDISADVFSKRLIQCMGKTVGKKQVEQLLKGHKAGLTRLKQANELRDIIWNHFKVELCGTDPQEIHVKSRELFETLDQKSGQQTYYSNLKFYLRSAGLIYGRQKRYPAFDAGTLPVLTRGLVPPRKKSIPFQDFVDLLRNELGFVVGLGKLTNSSVPGFDKFYSCTPWRNGEEIMRNLIANQKLLENRLVTAGLAKRFSDGRTEIFRVQR